MDDDYEGLWQDSEIRFDISSKSLAACPGEFELETLSNIEDSKGSSGEHGQLRLTNIRILWVSSKSPKTNLSIGLNCVLSINIRSSESRTRNSVQALFVLTKFSDSKFEFIFSHENRQVPRLFSTVQSLYNAFDTSRLFRDIKLRGGIMRDKALIMLPGERIISTTNGVWNLSGDQGNLGTLVNTNVRAVWFANLTENFNASVPFMQMKSVSKKLSKFGNALVIETTSRSGSFTLGFRVDPPEKLDLILKVIPFIDKAAVIYVASHRASSPQELVALVTTTRHRPNFGIEYSVADAPIRAAQPVSKPQQDDVVIFNSEESAGDA
jgi:Bardet-Biedl syndrome 5 protein